MMVTHLHQTLLTHKSRRKLDPAHVHATRSTRETETQSKYTFLIVKHIELNPRPCLTHTHYPTYTKISIISPSIPHKMTTSQQQLLLDLESESEDDERLVSPPTRQKKKKK